MCGVSAQDATSPSLVRLHVSMCEYMKECVTYHAVFSLGEEAGTGFRATVRSYMSLWFSLTWMGLSPEGFATLRHVQEHARTHSHTQQMCLDVDAKAEHNSLTANCKYMIVSFCWVKHAHNHYQTSTCTHTHTHTLKPFNVIKALKKYITGNILFLFIF